MNQKELDYILWCLGKDDRSVAADIRIFYKWHDCLITSKQAYELFIRQNNLDRSYLSVTAFVDFMRSLGYGDKPIGNDDGPVNDISISDGLLYIRKNLRHSRSIASSDAKVFSDWSHKRISTQEAFDKFTKNNKMDKYRIPIESFVIFMNNIGYDDSMPAWKKRLFNY